MEKRFGLVSLFLVVGLACHTTDVFLAQATVTPTWTPRPTYTPTLQATNTLVPTATAILPTATSTKNAPTPRPPTAKPPTQRSVVRSPTAPLYEFHVNPPTCLHSGDLGIKGTVYLNKSDPSQRYVGAIVALGAPDGSSMYVDPIQTNDLGEYSFVFPAQQPMPGTWGVWLVTPALVRKSDIGGPVTPNTLPPESLDACWTAIVDFWK